MSHGIIQTALTNRLRLELEYREPSFFRQSEAYPEQLGETSAELPDPERVLSDKVACVLSAI